MITPEPAPTASTPRGDSSTPEMPTTAGPTESTTVMSAREYASSSSTSDSFDAPTSQRPISRTPGSVSRTGSGGFKGRLLMSRSLPRLYLLLRCAGRRPVFTKAIIVVFSSIYQRTSSTLSVGTEEWGGLTTGGWRPRSPTDGLARREVLIWTAVNVVYCVRLFSA